MNEPFRESPTHTRRDLLRRAAWSLSALHVGAWARPLAADTPTVLEVSSPVRFRELRLQAPDPEALASFYQRALGLPVELRDAEIHVRAGASQLIFRQSAPGSTPHYHVAFNIPENKLDAAIRWAGSRFELLANPRAKTAGDPIVDFVNWNAHSVFFVDPAGNLLEFIARHELSNPAGGDFGPDDLLSVSEIGLVVDDVLATVDWLGDVGVDAYRPPNKAFTAMGDAHGLFIVIRRGRRGLFRDSWLGFDHSFPTEIQVEARSSIPRRIPGTSYLIRSF